MRLQFEKSSGFMVFLSCMKETAVYNDIRTYFHGRYIADALYYWYNNIMMKAVYPFILNLRAPGTALTHVALSRKGLQAFVKAGTGTVSRHTVQSGTHVLSRVVQRELSVAEWKMLRFR